MATKKNTTITGKDGKEYEYYRITRTIGHEWKNGEKVPIKKQFTGASKGAAEKKYKDFMEEQIRNEYEKATSIEAEKHKTFGELAEDYTYNVLMNSDYAHGTKRRYEQSYRVHIKDSFIMSIPIKEVSARTIQDCYQQLNVSAQNLDQIKKWMAAFYKWLALNNYAGNVLSAVTTPAKPDNKQQDDIIVWEPEEIEAIMEHSVDHRLRFMIIIMYYAGLRISECLGLKYTDMKNGILSVNRQYYQGELSSPKHNSHRKIPMHQEIIAALELHKQWHFQEMEQQKYDTDFVFTSVGGELLEYGNTRRSLVRFYRKNGIPEKKPHAYRSTFCTELCRHGVPLEVASKLMGHKSVEVTAKHYALIKNDVKEEAINKLPGISASPSSSYTVKRPTRKPRWIK